MKKMTESARKGRGHMSKLTHKQQEIYDYILSFAQENGYPPSVREIAQHVGLKSPSTVHFHLKGLREAGLISHCLLYTSDAADD